MSNVAALEPTQGGWQRLQEELHALLARRRFVVLEHAAWHGSADDEAGAMSGAQLEIDRIDHRVAELRYLLDRMEQGDNADRQRGSVGLGARVTVRWDDGAEETYRIVGPAAADPRQGWISTDSPVGRGLLDRRAGERVTVATPGGPGRLVVVAVA
jgi:transcription elongation GreA/GreB family factor